jgi:hypothetical protein
MKVVVVEDIVQDVLENLIIRSKTGSTSSLDSKREINQQMRIIERELNILNNELEPGYDLIIEHFVKMVNPPSYIERKNEEANKIRERQKIEREKVNANEIEGKNLLEKQQREREIEVEKVRRHFERVAERREIRERQENP